MPNPRPPKPPITVRRSPGGNIVVRKPGIPGGLISVKINNNKCVSSVQCQDPQFLEGNLNKKDSPYADNKGTDLLDPEKYDVFWQCNPATGECECLGGGSDEFVGQDPSVGGGDCQNIPTPTPPETYNVNMLFITPTPRIE